MKEFNLQTGKLGEEIAKGYLENKGYKIIEQNYKTKYGEIDLLARKGKELIVVEVRTKRGEQFGSPEESLDWQKLRKLQFNAQSYVSKNRWPGPCRIDAVCIVLKPDQTVERIEHYENII